MKPTLSIPALAIEFPALTALLVFGVSITFQSPAADDPVTLPGENKAVFAVQHYNLGRDKVAIKGYDPVSYFTRRQALKGKTEHIAQYGGVTYHFASVENQKLFTQAPERFLPTYGGWCATAMTKGEKVDIDPENFKVTNGRLFLFFKAFYANALKDWNKDEINLAAKADANWKRISGESSLQP